MLTYVALVVSLYGAGLSTWLGMSKRRRRLSTSAEWGVARLGHIRNHSFFVVSIINLGERAVTVRQIEWETDTGDSVTLHIFRHSKGPDLPVKVEPDEEVRVLFDPDHAAKALTESMVGPLSHLNVIGSGKTKPWRIELTDEMREEAREQLAYGDGAEIEDD